MVEVVKEVLSYGEKISEYGRCKVTKDGREWIELYGIVWSIKPSEQVWNDLEKTAEEIEQKFNVECLVAITLLGTSNRFPLPKRYGKTKPNTPKYSSEIRGT